MHIQHTIGKSNEKYIGNKLPKGGVGRLKSNRLYSSDSDDHQSQPDDDEDDDGGDRLRRSKVTNILPH